MDYHALLRYIRIQRTAQRVKNKTTCLSIRETGRRQIKNITFKAY
jgi:hypothetical protein